MHVAIQTIDGKVYQSDEAYEVEIQAAIDIEYSHQPKILRPSIDQYLDKIEKEVRDLRKMNYISMFIDGRNRYFNPENIIWMEIVR